MRHFGSPLFLAEFDEAHIATHDFFALLHHQLFSFVLVDDHSLNHLVEIGQSVKVVIDPGGVVQDQVENSEDLNAGATRVFGD